jgi:hypothetical protein
MSRLPNATSASLQRLLQDALLRRAQEAARQARRARRAETRRTVRRGHLERPAPGLLALGGAASEVLERSFTPRRHLRPAC